MKIKLSTFNDITGFVLAHMPPHQDFELVVKYVKNADEIHRDLENNCVGIVCMSYDDALSFYHQENHHDIYTLAPIHGGMLSLCGNVTSDHQLSIAIDTDCGYARLLRAYFGSDHRNIKWVYAGATNIRAEKLLAKQFDTTLLNPPFCYHPDISIITNLTGATPYQGMTFNTTKSFYDNNQTVIASFLQYYYATIASLLDHAQTTIEKLQEHYNIGLAQAEKTFQRIKASDGLAKDKKFEKSSLVYTEQLFSSDTGITLSHNHDWLSNAVVIQSF